MLMFVPRAQNFYGWKLDEGCFPNPEPWILLWAPFLKYSFPLTKSALPHAQREGKKRVHAQLTHWILGILAHFFLPFEPRSAALVRATSGPPRLTARQCQAGCKHPVHGRGDGWMARHTVVVAPQPEEVRMHVPPLLCGSIWQQQQCRMEVPWWLGDGQHLHPAHSQLPLPVALSFSRDTPTHFSTLGGAIPALPWVLATHATLLVRITWYIYFPCPQ